MRYVSILLFLGVVLQLSDLPAARGGIGHVVERIEVRGNEKTRTEIIQQALPLTVGHRLAAGDLDRCREVLQRLRLFRTVFVNAKPGATSEGAVLVIYVQEKRFGDLGVGLEYTELNGFGIAADAYHVNLRGEGKVVGVDYGLGERLKYWGFSYTDPWLRAKQSFHFQVQGTSSDRDLYRSEIDAVRGRYDLERIGVSLGIGQSSPLRAYQLVLKYAFEAIQIGEYDKPTIPTNGGLFADEISAALGRESLSFLTLEFSGQPASAPWGSAPGVDFGIRAELSAKPLGSVANFLRLRTELYRHFEIAPNHIISLGGHAGLIWGTPPFYERFYLDGENQLRGVDRRDIGPEGGTQFFMAEALYSLRLKQLGHLYAFGESGGLRRPIAQTHQEDTDFAFGIGFLLFNRVDISFGISTGTVIVKSHRFGGIKIGL